MSFDERRHLVHLYGEPVGTLYQRGDYTRFFFNYSYWNRIDRPVLGMYFEDQPGVNHTSTMRLPAWFSNLLPEGRLREWIAAEREVPQEREMELLAQVGHDLPGAVTIIPDEGAPGAELVEPGKFRYAGVTTRDPDDSRLRFSLAGVGLKFSMLKSGDHLTMPASGDGGDWIVKLPDANHQFVPVNEFSMMSWARLIGINVPETALVSRDDLDELPEIAWPNSESLAYAVRRFDRAVGTRAAVHIEDLAQVRGLYPDAKYYGSFETVAGLIYRGVDTASLLEFIKRLTFNFMIGNGDSHLKNWSLIYPDRRNPQISPAYDLVSTAPYFPRSNPEDTGLKFNGSKRFQRVDMSGFDRMAQLLKASDLGISEVVRSTARKTVEAWPQVRLLLGDLGHVQRWIDENLDVMARRFR